MNRFHSIAWDIVREVARMETFGTECTAAEHDQVARCAIAWKVFDGVVRRGGSPDEADRLAGQTLKHLNI